MPTYIVKLTNPDDPSDARLMEWSTVVDAPVTYGLLAEEFVDYYLEEHGRAALPILIEKLERVEAKGTSCRFDGEDTMSANRAGPDGSELDQRGLWQECVVRRAGAAPDTPEPRSDAYAIARRITGEATSCRASTPTCLARDVDGFASGLLTRQATPEDLARWVIADDERADADGECSMRDLFDSIYADDAEVKHGDDAYADEQLTAAGLLVGQPQRTAHVESWRTSLGRRVHALVLSIDKAEGAEDT